MIRLLPFLLLLLLAARQACAKVESLALVIGVDEGLSSDRALRYASRDAERMARVLRDLGGFGKDRVYLLPNPGLPRIRSTLEEIRGRVGELKRAGIQTSVLLYYSGHGSAEGLHVRGSRFSREEVNGLVESLGSDLKIVILDACESGDFLRRKGARILDGREIVKQDRLRSHGTIVLSSSSRGELAQESEDYKGAVFSHHLINGLRGLADYNADARVTLLEAFDYARASTRLEEIRGRAGSQNPTFDFDVVGEGDPVLARLERASARILFRGMPAVSMEVYNAQTLDLEHRLWLTAKDSAYYYLPSGKFILRYPDREGYRVANVDLTWSAETAVSPGQFRRLGKSLLSGKGAVGASLDFHGLQGGIRAGGPFLGSPMAGAEYVFRTHAFKQSLGFHYGRSMGAGAGTGLSVDTDAYRLGYSLRKPWLAFTYVQVQAGADLAWHRVLQSVKDTRFGADPPMAAGRPIRTRWTAGSNVLEAGLPLEAEFYFPRRFWLGVSASGTLYRYREAASGAAVYRYGIAPAVTLGKLF